jgi:hypothetical protein
MEGKYLTTGEIKGLKLDISKKYSKLGYYSF